MNKNILRFCTFVPEQIRSVSENENSIITDEK